MQHWFLNLKITNNNVKQYFEFITKLDTVKKYNLINKNMLPSITTYTHVVSSNLINQILQL